MREKDGAFYVQDCKIVKVENAKEMDQLLKFGSKMRAVAETKMNSGSSRSHSIFTIIVENSYTGDDGQTHFKMGKLNLVDLAGSERQSKTEAKGEVLEQAIKINLSLSTLGNVISALIKGKQSHIPYRESKLTTLLADSLGGNTKTVMIANIGPASSNFEETLNTLWYADRAKRIQNKPKINEDPKDALLRQYKEELDMLKSQLEKVRKGESPNSDLLTFLGSQGGSVEEKIVYVEDDSKLKEFEENMEKEKEVFLEEQKKEIKRIEEQKDLAAKEKESLIAKINSKAEKRQQEKDEQKALIRKMREMKKKVIKTDEVKDKLQVQQSEIVKAQTELKRKEEEEMKLQMELKTKAAKQKKVIEEYDSVNQHVDALNNEIEVVPN